MQRWTRNGMLSFSQQGEGHYPGQGASGSGRASCRGHSKGQRDLERNLSKVRKEWVEVKEEMGYARLLGEHLTESVSETDRKVAAMLEELDRADKFVQDILAQNDDGRIC